MIDYRDWQVPLGRRFRALKLWFVIRHYGVEGLRHHIRRHVALAQEFARWVEASPDFELAAPAPLNLVCFAHRAGDDFNRRLLERLNQSGKLYLTHTVLNGRYTLRLCVGQTHTEAAHVRQAWELIQQNAKLVEDSAGGVKRRAQAIAQSGMNPSASKAIHFTRRTFLHKTGALLAGSAILPHLADARGQPAGSAPAKEARGPEDGVATIEREVIWNGRQTGKSWFHPRTCLIPSAEGAGKPVVLMTLQEITGSDVFGQVHWTQTTDFGRTWREPEPIPAFARGPVEGGLVEGVCDVVPQFHPPTGVVLAMGHNVYYKAGKLAKPQEDRFPSIPSGTPDGLWIGAQAAEMGRRSRVGHLYTGSGERLLMANGDVLAAISFVPKGQTNRKVTSFRCAFDGRELTVKEIGNELANPVKRGLLEPSLARWRERIPHDHPRGRRPRLRGALRQRPAMGGAAALDV